MEGAGLGIACAGLLPEPAAAPAATSEVPLGQVT